jgi:hypothetical protein
LADRIQAILSGVDLPDLLTRIDFTKLQRGFHLRSDNADSFRLNFSELAGMPSTLNYATRIFGMREGRSIMPHGHHNLVSAHLAIQGDLHVRNFQRISDEPGYLLIEPTVDKVITVKDCSTQSSFRNNVHWFTARGGSAYTFDIVVDGLEPDQESGLDFIDPLHAMKAGEGRLRAPRLTREQAQRGYGNELHH